MYVQGRFEQTAVTGITAARSRVIVAADEDLISSGMGEKASTYTCGLRSRIYNTLLQFLLGIFSLIPISVRRKPILLNSNSIYHHTTDFFASLSRPISECRCLTPWRLDGYSVAVLYKLLAIPYGTESTSGRLKISSLITTRLPTTKHDWRV